MGRIFLPMTGIGSRHRMFFQEEGWDKIMSKHDDENRPHILVCNGKHCKESKSKKIKSRLKDLIEERDVGHLVAVESANCLGKCRSGPVVRIQPIGKVLTEVKPRHAEQVLNAALQEAGVLSSTGTVSE